MSRFWCSRYEAVDKGVVKETIEWANSKGFAWDTVKSEYNGVRVGVKPLN